MRRVVIDTNVWISAFLNRAGYPAAIVAMLDAGRFVSVSSSPLLIELTGVLHRPRFARKFVIQPNDIRDYVAFVRQHSDLVTVPGVLRICRDPKDDMVIETSLQGNADTLVTRDKSSSRVPELAAELVLRGVQIQTVQRFLDSLEADLRP